MTDSDKERHFSTDHLQSGLMQKAIDGLGFTLGAQGIKLLLQIGSIAIMARLLLPADFGLVAMATVFISLAMQFTDCGLSIATIQRHQINHSQVSNLFWINCALGFGLCFLGILVSPLLADLYKEPRLSLVMAVMSVNLLFGGLLVQPDALLRRQMRFKAASVIEILSMAIGIVSGIVAAIYGLEYWALVISAAITISTKTFMSWVWVGWFPSKLSRGSGVRPILGFGANLTSANFIGYVGSNLVPFSVGYIGGAQFLGLFNRANMLTSIPSVQILPSVMKVVQPTIARVAHDPVQVRAAITSILQKMVLVTMFITATMAVLADWIVQIFLGSGWESAVSLFQILAIFSIVEPIEGFLSVCLVATGNEKANLRWKIATLSILLVSIGIGSYWGAFGVVVAYALSSVLIRIPLFLIYARKFLPVTSSDLICSLMPSMTCAIVTTAVLYILRQYIYIESAFVGLSLFTLVAALVYTALCMLFSTTRGQLFEVFKFCKKIVSKN